VVAGDAPGGGECVDDVEPPAEAGSAGSVDPAAALVLDFDSEATAWAECGSDGELAAGQAGVAVLGGVGGQFGRAQDGVVGDDPALQ
jgi:hypothetical protein